MAERADVARVAQIQRARRGVAVEPPDHVGDVAVDVVVEAVLEPRALLALEAQAPDGHGCGPRSSRPCGTARHRPPCRRTRPSRAAPAARRYSCRPGSRASRSVDVATTRRISSASAGDTRSSASTSSIHGAAARRDAGVAPVAFQRPGAFDQPVGEPRGDLLRAVGAAVEHDHDLVGEAQTFEAIGEPRLLVMDDHQRGQCRHAAAPLRREATVRARQAPPYRRRATPSSNPSCGGRSPARRPARHRGSSSPPPPCARTPGRVDVAAGWARTGRASWCRPRRRYASARNRCRRRSEQRARQAATVARSMRPTRSMRRSAAMSFDHRLRRVAFRGVAEDRDARAGKNSFRRGEPRGERGETFRRPRLGAPVGGGTDAEHRHAGGDELAPPPPPRARRSKGRAPAAERGRARAPSRST